MVSDCHSDFLKKGFLVPPLCIHLSFWFSMSLSTLICVPCPASAPHAFPTGLATLWDPAPLLPAQLRVQWTGPDPLASPGEGNGNLLQYSCLDNPMDRRAWQGRVHGVAESDMT